IACRAGHAEHERKEHQSEPVGDVFGFHGDDGAAYALVDVLIETLLIASAEVSSGVRTEMLDRPTALGTGSGVAKVGLDPRFAKTLPRAKRQLRDGPRLHSQQRCDFSRLHLLDLGVPEHFLPA